MLYILRLTDGDCLVVTASNESGARESAAMLNPQAASQIASVRRLNTFGLRLSPTEEGCFEVSQWRDETVDEILSHEYPALDDACHRANSQKFTSGAAGTPILDHLKMEFDRTNEPIREALKTERLRFAATAGSKSRSRSH